MGKKPNIWKYLLWVTQLGASLAAPLILCALVGRWLQLHFSLGGWVMAISIFLGLATALLNLFKFFKVIQKEADYKKQEDHHGRF